MKRRNGRMWMILLAFLFLCAACVSGSLYFQNAGSMDAQNGYRVFPPPDPAVFFYERTPVRAQTRLDPHKETKTHRVFQVSFSSSFGTRHGLEDFAEVRAEYWQVKKSGRHPLIIAVALPGGNSFPHDRIREMITEWQFPPGDGFAPFHLVILDTGTVFFSMQRLAELNTEEEVLREYALVAERFRVIVLSIRRLLDGMEQYDEIDHARVGIVGASISGSLAAVAMGADSRIASGLFLVSGGDLAEILTSSEQKDTAIIRETVLRTMSWTQETLRAKLRPLFDPIDPISWARRIPPRPARLFLARFDDYIPPAGSYALWAQLGYNRAPLVFYAGHKTAFLAMTFLGGYRMSLEIRDFFQETLYGSK